MLEIISWFLTAIAVGMAYAVSGILVVEWLKYKIKNGADTIFFPEEIAAAFLIWPITLAILLIVTGFQLYDKLKAKNPLRLLGLWLMKDRDLIP